MLLQCPLGPDNRFVELAKPLIGGRKNRMELGGNLFEDFHCLQAIFRRLTEKPCICGGRGCPHIGGRLARPQIDQPLEIVHCIGKVGILLVELPAIEISVGIVGIGHLCAVVGNQRLVGLALIALRIAEIDPNIDMARHQRRRRGDEPFRLGGISPAERHQPDQVQCVRILRLRLKHGRRCLGGMFEPARGEVCAAKLEHPVDIVL